MNTYEDRHDVSRLRYMDNYSCPTRSGYYVVIDNLGKRHVAYYRESNPMYYPADKDPCGWYRHVSVANDPAVEPANADNMRSLGIYYWRTA